MHSNNTDGRMQSVQSFHLLFVKIAWSAFSELFGVQHSLDECMHYGAVAWLWDKCGCAILFLYVCCEAAIWWLSTW